MSRWVVIWRLMQCLMSIHAGLQGPLLQPSLRKLPSSAYLSVELRKTVAVRLPTMSTSRIMCRVFGPTSAPRRAMTTWMFWHASLVIQNSPSTPPISKLLMRSRESLQKRKWSACADPSLKASTGRLIWQHQQLSSTNVVPGKVRTQLFYQLISLRPGRTYPLGCPTGRKVTQWKHQTINLSTLGRTTRTPMSSSVGSVR